MMKKVRTIFSPRLICFGETFRALGAMMSCSSKAAGLVNFAEAIWSSISGSVFFGF